ncbi:META domain-containing protein [Paraflavitalea sp. CAU 1676]|uniref:META domain-containing protein n=1 Tax=Paraflavitalea sp. CAU 1676 TaxID=3032598 RepID=UPI0023DA1E5F|nr:META domain-containing protein [Paraflavitalea sp. CAU 1676]MDF2191945.1 META domain-containing protein [Paraflavitalea sp. CAU 1676]
MQKVLLFVALVAIMTGCAQKTVPTKDNTAHSSLTNTRWKLTALPALPSGLPKLPKDVFLQLDTGRIKGFGGCNNYFGGYTVQGDAISFKGIASTKMFCQETMVVEDKLFDALNNTTHYRITGTRLELLKDKDLLASFEALYLQ